MRRRATILLLLGMVVVVFSSCSKSGSGGGGRLPTSPTGSSDVTVTDLGNGFISLQPFNASIWINGLDEGSSCRSDTGHRLTRFSSSDALCGNYRWTVGQDSARQWTIHYGVILDVALLGLSVPLDLPSDWDEACTDGSVTRRLGNIPFPPPHTSPGCFRMPTNQSGLPPTERIVGYQICGPSFIEHRKPGWAIRRTIRGFGSCHWLFVNGLNIKTSEAMWVDGNSSGGQAPPGSYEATETLTVSERQ